jgi:hypothetical protein
MGYSALKGKRRRTRSGQHVSIKAPVVADIYFSRNGIDTSAVHKHCSCDMTVRIRGFILRPEAGETATMRIIQAGVRLNIAYAV